MSFVFALTVGLTDFVDADTGAIFDHDDLATSNALRVGEYVDTFTGRSGELNNGVWFEFKDGGRGKLGATQFNRERHNQIEVVFPLFDPVLVF
jgi:hypothetical protein